MKVNTDLYYTFYEVLDALWRRRYLFCVTVLIMPLCAFLVANMLPKKFQANTSILVYDRALLNPFLKDLAYSTELKKRITGLNVFINSPRVLEQVAIDSGLADKKSSREVLQEQVDFLANSLSIKMLGSNVVSIKLISGSPSKMVEILTNVRNTFITRLLAPQISSIESSEEFLKQQIAKQSRRLSDTEGKYALFKKNHADHLPSNSVLYAEQLQKVLIKINENETLLAGAKAEEITVKQNLMGSNPLVGHLELELITAKARYETLRSKYTMQHSELKKTKSKIISLEHQKKKLVDEINRLTEKDIKQYWDIAITSTADLNQSKFQPMLIEQLQNLQQANSRVKRIERETEILKNQVKKIRAKIAGISFFEKRLNELRRDVEVNQELYQKLKKRLAMASVTGDLGKFEQNTLVKVIELPQTPTKPINKPIIFFVIAGILGGFIMGAGLVIVLEILDSTVRQSRTVEQHTGVPVFCRMSAIKAN